MYSLLINLFQSSILRLGGKLLTAPKTSVVQSSQPCLILQMFPNPNEGDHCNQVQILIIQIRSLKPLIILIVIFAIARIEF